MALTRMTEGKIPKQLLQYAVPLVLGNLFQLTYNAVDSIIVGRLISKEALAAVGTANPVMSIIVLGISGVCIGAGVLMSQFYGAGQEERVRSELATTLLFGLYFSLGVVAMGTLFARPLLAALQVPAEILDMATAYLRVVFWGAPFTYLYNAVAGALKSVGDSTTPLKFLALASVLNGGMDALFIGVLGMGVVSSAVATVLAEGISALLCILYVYRHIPLLQLHKDQLRIDGGLLRKTLQYGGVTALQQSCQPIGKLLIQGCVNTLGVDVMAAFNAVNRIDDYAMTPEQSISHAMTTFVAQNRGARQEERARKGIRHGFLLESGYWLCISTVLTLLRRPLMELFVGKNAENVVAQGCAYLALMALFYLFPAYTNGIQGTFRGLGNMRLTLLCTIIQTGIRVLCTLWLSPTMGIVGVAYACAAGWSAMLLFEIPYYFYYMKHHSAALFAEDEN